MNYPVQKVQHSIIPDCDCGWNEQNFWTDFFKEPFEVALWIPGSTPTTGIHAQKLRRNLKKAKDYEIVSGFDVHNTHIGDVYRINTSKEERQGRRMALGYWEYPGIKNNPYDCPYHGSTFFGAMLGDILYGYIISSGVGEMAGTSMIIAHADHLKNGIMHKLMQAVLEYYNKPYFYYRWNSGFETLKHWKATHGFRPALVRVHGD